MEARPIGGMRLNVQTEFYTNLSRKSVSTLSIPMNESDLIRRKIPAGFMDGVPDDIFIIPGSTPGD